MKQRILAIILCVTAPAVATQYYVDSNHGTGGDGLSDATAWDQLSDIGALAAGDTVNLKRGSLWRESLSPGYSGTAGSPITYAAYGTGELPIITGSDSMNPITGDQWTLSTGGTSEYYWNASIADPTMVWVNGTTAGPKRTVGSLADGQWGYGNNDTLGYNTVYLRQSGGDPDTTGVSIEKGARNYAVYVASKSYLVFSNLELRNAATLNNGVVYLSTATGITIQNCKIHDGYYGINNAASGTNINITDSEIYNALWYVYGNNEYAECVRLIGVSGGSVARCTIHNAYGFDAALNATAVGLGFFSGTTNLVIEKNNVYSNNGDQVYSWDGATNNIIRYNYIHDGSNGTIFRQGSNSNSVYANLYVNASPALQLNSSGGVTTGNKFYNNTIYDNSPCKAVAIVGNHTGELKNNIIWANVPDASGNYYGMYCDSTAGFVSNYNRWYNPAGAGIAALWIWQGTWYSQSQFATYKTASGQDAASSTGDPGMIDPGIGYYGLSDSSPCINVGVNLGDTYDDCLDSTSTWTQGVLTLDQDSFGAGWEMGAIVKGTTPPPPPPGGESVNMLIRLR